MSSHVLLLLEVSEEERLHRSPFIELPESESPVACVDAGREREGNGGGEELGGEFEADDDDDGCGRLTAILGGRVDRSGIGGAACWLLVDATGEAGRCQSRFDGEGGGRGDAARSMGAPELHRAGETYPANLERRLATPPAGGSVSTVGGALLNAGRTGSVGKPLLAGEAAVELATGGTGTGRDSNALRVGVGVGVTSPSSLGAGECDAETTRRGTTGGPGRPRPSDAMLARGLWLGLGLLFGGWEPAASCSNRERRLLTGGGGEGGGELIAGCDVCRNLENGARRCAAMAHRPSKWYDSGQAEAAALASPAIGRIEGAPPVSLPIGDRF
ncbi:hypothetical protein AURDEDRAFT_126476 [Auricularia subglabra TFB-10046 SS5]|nr:hypothetical protein AURDEDRAFT_126476 [Auricularia subglabra TFB-10046 SS5]